MASRIERFARETLGCRCSGEVFERIEETPDPVPGCPEIARSIAIGGRLLIYLIEAPEVEDVAAWAEARLADWVDLGIVERERRGMSRLRLAIAMDAPEPEIVACLDTAFVRLTALPPGDPDATDPRVHLHCLNRSQVDALVAGEA